MTIRSGGVLRGACIAALVVIVPTSMGSGCRRGRTDAGPGSDAAPGTDAAAALDSGMGTDALPDTDAALASDADASAPAACVGSAPSTASAQLLLGAPSAAGSAYVAMYATGAAVAWSDATGAVHLQRIDGAGASSAPESTYGALGTLNAFAFDGAGGFVLVYGSSMPSGLHLRTVDASGVLGAGVPIPGALLPGIDGALAHDAVSGETAVLFEGSDGALHAAVVSGGTVVADESVAPMYGASGFLLLASVTATPGAASNFLVAYPDVTGAAGNTVSARPLSPLGSAVLVSAATAVARARIDVERAALPGEYVVTWVESFGDVHAATIDDTGATVVAERVVRAAAAGESVARAGVWAAPSGGFEVLADVAVGSDRWVELVPLTAAGDPDGAVSRIASICSLSLSEGSLPFQRGVARFASWVDYGIGRVVAATF